MEPLNDGLDYARRLIERIEAECEPVRRTIRQLEHAGPFDREQTRRVRDLEGSLRFFLNGPVGQTRLAFGMGPYYRSRDDGEKGEKGEKEGQGDCQRAEGRQKDGE
jgi:hypothetical protein